MSNEFDSAPDCSCSQCVNACKRMPGGFAPGEAEKAAELLKVPFEEFKKLLIKNYWRDFEEDAMIWQPRKVDSDPEMTVATDRYTNTRGRCVFLTDEDRCRIHEAKPFECRVSRICEKRVYVWPELNRMWLDSGEKI